MGKEERQQEPGEREVCGEISSPRHVRSHTHEVSPASLPKKYLEEDDAIRQVRGVGVKFMGPQLWTKKNYKPLRIAECRGKGLPQST